MRKTLSALLFGATLLLTSPAKSIPIGLDLMPVTWKPGISRVDILEATEDLEPRIIRMVGVNINPSMGCLGVVSPLIRYQVNLLPGERPIDACDYLKTVGAGPDILSECDYAVRWGSKFFLPSLPLSRSTSLTVDYAPCPPNQHPSLTEIKGSVTNVVITPQYTTLTLTGKTRPSLQVPTLEEFAESGGRYEITQKEESADWTLRMEGNFPTVIGDKIEIYDPNGLADKGDIHTYSNLVVRDEIGREKFTYKWKAREVPSLDHQFGDPLL